MSSEAKLALIIVVCILLLFAVAGCAGLAKPQYIATSPSGKTTVELYPDKCENELALGVLDAVKASAPVPIEGVPRAALWKDPKNRIEGCWIEIVHLAHYLITFEDGDVYLLDKRGFKTPASVGIDRFRARQGFIEA